MPLRRPTRWLVRGLIMAVLAAFGGGIWYAQSWVDPEHVHAAVCTALQEQFPHSRVEVESVRLSVFGGITVTNLSVTWPGETTPFFSAPTAIIAHDKERLNQGKLAIRKIELEKPKLRIECGPDGTWKLPGLDRDTPSDRAVPTFVVREASLHLLDRRAGGYPELHIENAKMQLVNDPLPMLKVQGQATIAPYGDVILAAQFNRETNEAFVKVELPDVPIGPDFSAEVAKFRPDVAEWIAKIRARASIKAEVTYQPKSTIPVRPDVRLEIKDGTFDDPMLPWPAEQVTASIRLVDGKLKVEKATAKIGQALAEINFETRTLPGFRSGQSTEAVASNLPGVTPPSAASGNDLFGPLEQQLVGMNATLHNLPLVDTLIDRLPLTARAARERLNPVGSVDLSYKFTRLTSGWKREIEVKPNKLAFTYSKFRYPVKELEGSIKKTVTPDGSDEVAISLQGIAGGKRMEIRGRVAGGGDDPLIDLRITGDDIPIDDVLFDALYKEKHRDLLKRLHAKGRGDFVATIRQDPGINRVVTVFNVTVKDGQLCYDRFAYPLEKIRGRVAVRVITSDNSRPNAPGTYHPNEPDPDTVEIRDFVAQHGAGTIMLNGTESQIPRSRDRGLNLDVQAKNCPLDESLARAFEQMQLGEVWRTFLPKGSATLGMNVFITDRAGPLKPDGTTGPEPEYDADRDLKLTVNFKGPTITPDFFPYEITNLAGVFRYEGNGIDLHHFSGQHGNSQLALDAGEVRLRPDGTVWANLGGVTATPLIVGKDFLAALPKGLRNGLTDLNPRGAMDLTLKHMVVLVPPASATPAALPATQTRQSSKHGRGVTVARGQSPESAGAKKYGMPIIYWDGNLKMAGAAADIGTALEDLHGVIACRGRYESDRLSGAVGNAWIDSGTVSKQPVSTVNVTFTADPQRADPSLPGAVTPISMRFTDLHGKLFRGEIGGEARVVLSEPTRFRVLLSAQNVRLEDVAAHHQLGKDAEFTGLAQAKIVFERELDPKTGKVQLQGVGNVDVPSGKMYKLPVILDLIKVAKLQTPDQTGFEEAHATFRIRNDRIVVDQLDLLGSAVSLGGSGEMDFDAKDVKFEFYTIWSQTLKRWLTTSLGDPTSALSDKLFRIEATRTNGGDFKFTPRVVPVVTDPFRAIAERVRLKTGLPNQADPTYRATGQ
ncbi:MAG: hypothetical protein U0798_01325 [Gemmataceae bacterium]